MAQSLVATASPLADPNNRYHSQCQRTPKDELARGRSLGLGYFSLGHDWVLLAIGDKGAIGPLRTIIPTASAGYTGIRTFNAMLFLPATHFFWHGP